MGSNVVEHVTSVNTIPVHGGGEYGLFGAPCYA
jgi:hypothetical protein